LVDADLPVTSLSCGWNNTDGTRKQIRSSLKDLYAIGPRIDPSVDENKEIGNLATKLSRSLRLAENKEQVPIDIVCDGGLSTIWTVVAGAAANDNLAGAYDDEEFLAGVHETGGLNDQNTGTSSSVQNDWSVVYSRLETFCSETRKD